MKIGVFDSGVGGLSVANAIRTALPEHEVILREDKDNLPYGTKTPVQLLELVTPILEQMTAEGCGLIVIACNTVTTNIINELRQRIGVPLVGMEPMVRPAAKISKTGVIAVFATPATLNSRRYKWLKDNFAKDTDVIEPDCSRWALMIENNDINREEIETEVMDALDNDADVLVLGCTHYHWIEELIKQITNDRALVLQPEQPVIEQVKKVLAQTI